MTSEIDRRTALGLIGTGAATGLIAPAHGQTRDGPGEALRFMHGVASGDPTAQGAILWTRVTVADGARGAVPLTWQVALTPDGPAIQSGRQPARASADHTAKLEVRGLAPATDHWFWFTAPDGTRSPAGRFRTLPVGATADFVFALASCQLYPGGYFNAYQDMAALERLDLVLHLGDYIYEYGATGYGTDIGRAIGRLPDPPHETVTLDDYRRRHAQTKADPAMQAAHARAAFICVWDDHEITNDGWIGGAENHQPETEGSWRTRKAAAMQAYFEWMPIRNPARRADPAAIFRSFEIGDLATIAMLETRLLARDEQVAPKGEVPDPADIADMLALRLRPERELLGAAQTRWLGGVLRASVAAGKRWQLLGNQVVAARVAGPDLRAAWGAERYAAFNERLPAQWRTRLDAAQVGFRAGLPFNLDAWDGYPAARERLYALLRRSGGNPLLLAGDSHAAWANDLYDDAGNLIGAEFGTTAITSPSYGSLIPGLGAVLSDANREVAYCDQDGKGYTLVTLTPDAATAEFVTVSTVREPVFTRRVSATAHKRRDGAPMTIGS